MFNKISLHPFFSVQTRLSEIKLAEEAIEPIFKAIGVERGNSFIKQFVNHIISKKEGDFNYIGWFKNEDDVDIIKLSLKPLVNGLKKQEIEQNEINNAVLKDTQDILSLIKNISLDLSEKEFKNTLELINFEMKKDFYNPDFLYYSEKNNTRKSMIRKSYNKLVEYISEQSSEIISFDTALSGKFCHAIASQPIKIGRYSRNDYETLCSPKKDLVKMNGEMNESGVDCPKCLIKLFNIAKNK